MLNESSSFYKWYIQKNSQARKHETVQFTSRRYLCAWKSPYMHFPPSLRSFPNTAFETVPMFVWLTTALPHPFKEDHLVLLLSTPLSSRRSLVKKVSATPLNSISQGQTWQCPCTQGMGTSFELPGLAPKSVQDGCLWQVFLSSPGMTG